MKEPIQHIDGPFTAGCRNDSITFHDEPVYEYRVVCADGGEWRLARSYGKARRRSSLRAAELLVASARGCGPHGHTVERRSVGPWEAC